MSDSYEIQGYSNYTLTKKGVLYHSKPFPGGGKITKVEVGWVTNSGYLSYDLTDDAGVTHLWGIHRLLAWVFIANFDNIDGMVVKHLDGVKLNNALDNLEIVTYQENAEHAGRLSLTDRCKLVMIRNVETKEVLKFPSIRKAATHLNLSPDVVGNRLMNGEDIIYSDFNQYKIGDEDFKELEVEDVLDQIHYGRKQRIYKRCLKTDTVTAFDSCRELAKDMNVSEASISTWVRIKTQPVLKGLVQIQLAKELTEWVDHLYPLKVYEHFNNTRVVIVELSNGEKKVCLSAKEAADTLGIGTTTLDYRLKQPRGRIFKDGTKCHYYSRSPVTEMSLG